MNTLIPYSWFLRTFSNKKNQNSIEKCLILRLELEINKMRLEHCIVPQYKKVILQITRIEENMSKGDRSQLKEYSVANAETIWAMQKN